MALQGGEFGDKDYARLTGKSVGGDDSSSPTLALKSEDPKPVAPATPPVVGEQDQWMDSLVELLALLMSSKIMIRLAL